ncbi:MAG: hypothetical protein IJV94_00580 [Bacilli bacterium]|nr:hypothetical protein [Bacilli bacterium]
MDELMNRQNTIKEIKSTIIVLMIWIVGMIIFGFINFDLMYLIINGALFVFTLIILFYYLKKYRKIMDKIEFYISDKYEVKDTMDCLIVDYYKQVIDEKIEKEIDATCYSILNDKELTLELEKKDYILFVKLINGEVSYAVSALDEEFYSRTTRLYEITKNEILSDEYFAKVDGKDTFVITSINNEEIYNFIIKFIKEKMAQVDELFSVYNESLKLLDKED